MKHAHVIFVINLMQDINIARPLVYLASRDLNRPTLFLVTSAFTKRDSTGTWRRELNEIGAETNTTIVDFSHEFEALQVLQDKSGVLIASSESHLPAHREVHDLLRIAPSQFLKVTLQHGFECIGFHQSRDQDIAHGRNISFAADVICGWADASQLNAITPSQRHKLCVTGPTLALREFKNSKQNGSKIGGIVCENMHSPRLRTVGDFKVDFLATFDSFCKELQLRDQQVTLRPHPGGQYTLKNDVALAENVILNNMPIYKVDLSSYSYGISAPSSVLIDMVLSGIPVAVWQDSGSLMDIGNYEGLTRISSLQEWLEFSEAAVANPEHFLRQQNYFLQRHQLKTSVKEVRSSFTTLLNSKLDFDSRMLDLYQYPIQQHRIIYVSNGYIPTLQLSFVKPLDMMLQSYEVAQEFVNEATLQPKRIKELGYTSSVGFIKDLFAEFKPTIVVFCRYSGHDSKNILECALNDGIPTVYHIDDDLLNIPEDIGTNKFKFHNAESRLNSVNFLLKNVNLIYCSTEKLKAQLQTLPIATPITVGSIYCSGHVINPVQLRPVKKIGYMASADHAHNLKIVIPAIQRLLRKHPEVVFEFFGSIPAPPEFAEFGSRIKHAPKIDNYSEFLQRFAEYEWDIGICPLTPIHFNMMKANTKWVEYTTVGAAVVASKGTVYDGCCADGCGILAETVDDWFAALDYLTSNPQARFRQVQEAQRKLTENYSTERLRRQVLDIFSQAKHIHQQVKLSHLH